MGGGSRPMEQQSTRRLNREYLGRRYLSESEYHVSREAIRKFADAIGDDSPLHRDPSAARAQGLPDVVAPPTFLTVVDCHLDLGPLKDPEFVADPSTAVHGEQRYSHSRPVFAGDAITVVRVVEEISDVGRHEMLRLRDQYRDVENNVVATAYSTIIVRQAETA